MRVTRVTDDFYKIEEVPAVSPFGAPIAGAIRRAIRISGLEPSTFFLQVLALLNFTVTEAEKALAHSGLTIANGITALTNGDVVPCADVLLAAAVVAGTTVGILLDESPMAEEVRELHRQVREYQRGLTLRVTRSS